jgi:hypothetical protein
MVLFLDILNLFKTSRTTYSKKLIIKYYLVTFIVFALSGLTTLALPMPKKMLLSLL